VPRLVARLIVDYFTYAARPVLRLVARLVVAWLVINHFAYDVRLGASAALAARR
jgi:hypothetical protein